MTCTKCEDRKWVCEDHPDKAFKSGSGCCGGAGMLCECSKHLEDKALAEMAKEAEKDVSVEFKP